MSRHFMQNCLPTIKHGIDIKVNDNSIHVDAHVDNRNRQAQRSCALLWNILSFNFDIKTAEYDTRDLFACCLKGVQIRTSRGSQLYRVKYILLIQITEVDLATNCANFVGHRERAYPTELRVSALSTRFSPRRMKNDPAFASLTITTDVSPFTFGFARAGSIRLLGKDRFPSPLFQIGRNARPKSKFATGQRVDFCVAA